MQRTEDFNEPSTPIDPSALPSPSSTNINMFIDAYTDNFNFFPTHYSHNNSRTQINSPYVFIGSVNYFDTQTPTVVTFWYLLFRFTGEGGAFFTYLFSGDHIAQDTSILVRNNSDLVCQYRNVNGDVSARVSYSSFPPPIFNCGVLPYPSNNQPDVIVHSESASCYNTTSMGQYFTRL